MPNHLIILVVTVEMGSVHLVLPSEQREPGSLFQVTFGHEVSVYHLKEEVGLELHCHGDERLWERTLSIS